LLNAQVLVLNDSVEVYNVLNNSVYTLIDDNKPLEEQVNQSTKWEKFERNTIRFRFSRNSYLVRTIITNHSKQPFFTVTCAHPDIDHFELLNYQLKPVKSAGDTLPYNLREFQESSPTLSYTLTKSTTDTVYFKVYMTERGAAPIILKTAAEYHKSFSTNEWIDGLFVGTMSMAALYFLFLYYSEKEKFYVHFALNIVIITLILMSLTGNVLLRLYGDFAFISRVDSILLMALFGASTNSSIYHYFKFTGKTWLSKGLTIIIFVYIASAIISLFYISHIFFLQNIISLCLFLSFILSVFIIKKGLDTQKEISSIFIAGFVIILIGIMLHALQNNALISYSPLIHIIVNICFLLGITTCSLIVAYRRFLMQQEEENIKLQLQIEKVNSTKLELRSKDVQLISLKKQMNPHFVFNSLNSIHNLILKDKTDDASKYLVTFAKLMRRSLLFTDAESITVPEEIDFLKSYLQIEKLRFRDRFDFEIIADNEVLETDPILPPLLLLIFAENAVKHAFKENTLNGKILVTFSIIDDFLHIEVDDNGMGLIASPRPVEHKSKGLSMILERIELLNRDAEYKITLDIKDKASLNLGTTGVLVTLRVPLD
jgi:sensor histidine kinase YesM